MSFISAIGELKKVYLILKLLEVKHRFTYGRHNKRMVLAMERFKVCNCKKSKSKMKKEINICKKFWGCYPLHYYRYDLYRRDKDMSERELLNYIPEFYFYNLFLPYYDSRKYEILLTDKIITEQLFRSLAIPQPQTICKLINNHIYTSELEEKGYEDVKQELIENKYKKIFVKPADGEGGHGLFIFNKNKSGQYITKDNEVLDEVFLSEIGARNNYIIQPGIEQDPEISEIYPHSVNTFRIATENKNGNIRILCATLRIGRGGMQVDNGTQGGIMIKIDLNTGEIASFANSETCEYFQKHPDTNFVFEEGKITEWKRMKDFVIKSAEKLALFTYLGWDIALTQNGPVAIETNLNFGLDHYQVALGGLREIFGIHDPQYYWKNMKKSIKRGGYVH